jgi:hypothetical protein
MTLDPTTRKQLIEARERIKAQLIDDECAANDPLSYGGAADFRGVYAELQEQLSEIDALLGRDADEDEEVSTVPPSTYFPFWASDTDYLPKRSIFLTAVMFAGLAYWVIAFVRSCVWGN